MMKIAVVGATGPSMRVIARSADRLARLFPEAAVEKQSVDVLDADATLRAIEGCDLGHAKVERQHDAKRGE